MLTSHQTNMRVIFVSVICVALVTSIHGFLVPWSSATFSCSGRCGQKGSDALAACQCNSACGKFGDCCTDYQTICVDKQQPDTCAKRCGQGNDASKTCQCNSACKKHGDCCPDYQATCISCESRCDQQQYDKSKGCQCNDKCDRYNNCCSDFDNACAEPVQPGASCLGRCEQVLAPVAQCQCNSACVQYEDCCVDYGVHCDDEGWVKVTKKPPGVTKPKGATNTEILSVSSALYDLDDNKIAENHYGIYYSGDTFFYYMDESKLKGKTYAAFIQLLDNYNPQVGKAEKQCWQCEQEENAFIDAIMSTRVMQRLWQFLSDRGLASTSSTGFKKELRQYWFLDYSRSKGRALDSSGFEHVYVGEIKSGKVTGFHSWIHFYMQESQDKLQFTKYKKTCNPGIRSVSMDWLDKPKISSSIFPGSSPELELSLFTLCFVTRPGELCKVSLDGNTRTIKTYSMDSANKNTIGSAYFNC